VPWSIARKLALEKLDREEFTLADGTHRAYDVGEAFFELGERRGTSKVVFGPANVTPLHDGKPVHRLWLKPSFKLTIGRADSDVRNSFRGGGDTVLVPNGLAVCTAGNGVAGTRSAKRRSANAGFIFGDRAGTTWRILTSDLSRKQASGYVALLLAACLRRFGLGLR
jgi:hypothetical protein